MHRITASQRIARPGYYSVKPLTIAYRVELTVSERVASINSYFPKGKEAHVIIDPKELTTGDRHLHQTGR